MCLDCSQLYYATIPCRPKHPVKVHIWGGISCSGTTDIVIFDGIMTADCYVDIIKRALVPFIHNVFPEGHRFMQDNDPKHTSKVAQRMFEEESINWWKTPAESPDCNPIENLWHELKEYNRRVEKPTTKQELVDGLYNFWSEITVEKCRKYINHLRKVVPKLIENNGGPTGY